MRTSTISLTIDIGDENDNTPSCTQYTYTEAKLETVGTGTTVNYILAVIRSITTLYNTVLLFTQSKQSQ